MTANQINKELDKLDAISSAITDEFISANRGHETSFQIMKQTDPLSVRYRENVEKRWELLNEIARLWGPGMHRAPVKQPKTIGRRVM
jgi:hypothetical protein